MKELIEGAGAKLIYLSAYSPELNPIELIFGTCIFFFVVVVVVVVVVDAVVVIYCCHYHRRPSSISSSLPSWLSSQLFNSKRYVQGIFERAPR